MGAWDELDTIIETEVDVSNLDAIMDIDDEYGIFDDIKEYADELKTAIYEGSENGTAYLSNFDRSQQNRYIRENCDNPSGMLASSIYDEEDAPLKHTIGTILNHIYPMSVEYGRKEVHPIPPKKRLRFYGEGGYLIYPLMSKEAKPRPFVAPAYEDTDKISKQIMLMEINHSMEY